MNPTVVSIVLVIASVGLFVGVFDRQYDRFKELRVENAEYDAALTQAKNLRKVRDELLGKYRTITNEQRDRLVKLLPDSVDSVRLVTDLNSIADSVGVSLKDMQVNKSENTESKTNSTRGMSVVQTPRSSNAGPASAGGAPTPGAAGGVGATTVGVDQQKYGNLGISFTVSGSYEEFIAFLKELEASLRIIDVQSVSVKGIDDKQTFGVTAKTYWLK